MDKRTERRLTRELIRALNAPASRGSTPSRYTKKNAFAMIAFLFAAAFGLLNITAPSASAESVTITATVVGSAVAEAEATVDAEAVGSSYAYAVAQVRSKAKVVRSGCITSPGINTYYSGGKLVRNFDPVPARICPLVQPVIVDGHKYEWKKIGGGTTGTNCGNYFVPTNTPPPGVSTIVVLDVRTGTIAKIRVKARVCVNATVHVLVRLRYTYKGETKEIKRRNSDTDRACKTVRKVAKKRITKKTSRKASAAAVARVKAKARTKATAKARTKATAKARTKAVRTVSVVIELDEEETPPSISASARACVDVNDGNTGVVDFTVVNNNDSVDTFTVSANTGQSTTIQVAANSQANGSLLQFAPGSYILTVRSSNTGLQTTTSVTVEQCDVPVTPPTGSVTCKNPPHLYAPDGNAIMICELSWSDGHKPKLSEFQIEASNGNAYFAQPTEFGFREEAEINPCPANTLCVRNQVWAVQAGLFEYRYRISGGEWIRGQFMIEPDDF